jgi:hypothetical protein
VTPFYEGPHAFSCKHCPHWVMGAPAPCGCCCKHCPHPHQIRTTVAHTPTKLTHRNHTSTCPTCSTASIASRLMRCRGPRPLLPLLPPGKAVLLIKDTRSSNRLLQGWTHKQDHTGAHTHCSHTRCKAVGYPWMMHFLQDMAQAPAPEGAGWAIMGRCMLPTPPARDATP